MPIRRRTDIGDGTPERPHPWLVSVNVDGQRVRRVIDGSLTRAQAREVERALAAEIGPARGRDRLAPDVRQLVERYWLEHGRHIASWRTERSYCALWARELGQETRVSAINGGMVSALVARWRAEPALNSGQRRSPPALLTPSAINHRLSALQRMLSLAEDVWQWHVERIPWRRLRLAEPEPRDRSLSPAQLERLFAAMPARSLLPHLFSLWTGLRRGGVLRITAADIDWQAGIIRTVSKGRAGGRPTPVPITEPVTAILQALDRLPEVGRIWTVTEQQLRDDREKARAAAGVPGMTWTSLRHTFAQRLEDAGLGDHITDALHHSSPALRRRYARARIERTRAAIERSLRR